MDLSAKQAVLFDLGGTIIDSAPGIIRSAQYALRHFGREMDEISLRPFIGPPLKECFTEVCGLPEGDAEQAVLYYRERYGTVGKFECSLYPGVEQLLRELWEAGKTVLLATSKPEQFAREILEHFNIARYFHRIGGATFDHTRESKEAVIEYVLDYGGGIGSETAVMVGDRKFDIAGAKAFGMASLGVLYGFGSREELEKAGADCLADSARQVGDLLLGRT